jgi:hypothetical protein
MNGFLPYQSIMRNCSLFLSKCTKSPVSEARTSTALCCESYKKENAGKINLFITELFNEWITENEMRAKK